MLHNIPLSHDNVRVVVEKIVVPGAHVPYPNDEVQTVDDALSQFIAWPRQLVELGTEIEVQQRRRSKGKLLNPLSPDPSCPSSVDVSGMSREFHMVKTLAIGLAADEFIDINMDVDIVGKQYGFHIYREEIV
ncbi:unnamed protein product [Cuscuta europaea]|nr:unnamed protein product [Cuscuta europaea]